MKNQALVSSKDKSKKLECHLLQFLFGALRIKQGIFRLKQVFKTKLWLSIFQIICKSNICNANIAIAHKYIKLNGNLSHFPQISQRETVFVSCYLLPETNKPELGSILEEKYLFLKV